MLLNIRKKRIRYGWNRESVWKLNSSTPRHGCWKLVPHANDLAVVRDTWAAGPHNRSPFIFRVARAFVAFTERPKLVLRSTPKRYQVQAGKVTVPLSRVPGSPGSRQTGSRLIHRRRFRYSAPFSFSLFRFLRLVLIIILRLDPETRLVFDRFEFTGLISYMPKKQYYDRRNSVSDHSAFLCLDPEATLVFHFD